MRIKRNILDILKSLGAKPLPPKQISFVNLGDLSNPMGGGGKSSDIKKPITPINYPTKPTNQLGLKSNLPSDSKTIRDNKKGLQNVTLHK